MRKKRSEQSEHDEMWMAAASGDKAIDFQKSALGTWWSILQGIAVATLVGKLPDLVAVIIEEQKWYLILFVIATFMIIVNVWIGNAWSILVWRWRLTLINTALQTLLGTATQLLCVYVEVPQYWFLALALLPISSIMIYRFSIYQKTILNTAIQTGRSLNTLYAVYAILCLVAAFTVSKYPTPLLHYIWGVVFVIAAGLSWKVQSDIMRTQRAQLNIP